jgi:hypothetical protein
VFRKYGKHLTFTKPNGRVVCFFNAPLTQVKKAKTTAEVDAVPDWGPRRTQTRLLDSCAICGNPDRIEMHHVRHIRKRGESVRGFRLYLAALNRKGCDRAIPTACSDRQRESPLLCEPNVWSAGMGLAGRSSFGEMMENTHFLS